MQHGGELVPPGGGYAVFALPLAVLFGRAVVRLGHGSLELVSVVLTRLDGHYRDRALRGS